MASVEGEERVVFFEADFTCKASSQLEFILQDLWQVDTEGWTEQGHIYNYDLVSARLREDHSDGELHVLAVGWGGDSPCAIGVDRVHYVQRSRADLFVSPRVARRIHELFDEIERLRAAEPARRAAATSISEASAADVGLLTCNRAANTAPTPQANPSASTMPEASETADHAGHPTDKPARCAEAQTQPVQGSPHLP
ncbi:MAG: hypothetical protein EPO09_00085 [Aquabacterium sp.]|uniref:hypothetical protein n=1 Tax=Aquabacterium sp. TaxID=1872578 RepID=UPI0012141139|nr:hypothetical protein [Aquabacterium sp.]TAL00151.1 MAG: hypothetical protein EPO09_00085 [Aquabacterium sp.]